MTMTNYYQTLGVNQSASDDEIKTAYRKLAMKHHPDRAGGDDTEFKKIQEAYATLSDPQQRAQYDNPHPQGFPGSGFNFSTGGFEDIFAQAFGGGSPFGDMFGHRQGPQRNRSLNIQTQITLEEAFFGKELVANLNLPSGKNQTIEIKIPAGINDGTTLRLAGMGDNTHPNLPRGDIHLTVNIFPHTIFQRQGDDLIRSIEISCVDAMLGSNVLIETIDKKTLDIKITPGTQQGQTLATQGYGMPNLHNPGLRGRMLVTIQLSVPTNLTEDQKIALKKVFN